MDNDLDEEFEDTLAKLAEDIITQLVEDLKADRYEVASIENDGVFVIRYKDTENDPIQFIILTNEIEAKIELQTVRYSNTEFNLDLTQIDGELIDDFVNILGVLVTEHQVNVFKTIAKTQKGFKR